MLLKIYCAGNGDFCDASGGLLANRRYCRLLCMGLGVDIPDSVIIASLEQISRFVRIAYSEAFDLPVHKMTLMMDAFEQQQLRLWRACYISPHTPASSSRPRSSSTVHVGWVEAELGVRVCLYELSRVLCPLSQVCFLAALGEKPGMIGT